MKSIAIINRKGGVGKTTTAATLADMLAADDFPVLLIDLDPQSSLSDSMGVDTSSGTIGDCFPTKNAPAQKMLEDVAVEFRPGLWVVPSSDYLTDVQTNLVNVTRREDQLKRLLSGLSFSLCIVDCPPNLDLLTINALTACDAAILPVKAQFLDLAGLAKQLDNLDQLKADLNPNFQILGVLPTQFDKRTLLHRESLEAVKDSGLPIFKPVPLAIAVAEAPGFGQTVASYAPQSPAANAYREVANHIRTWANE